MNSTSFNVRPAISVFMVFLLCIHPFLPYSIAVAEETNLGELEEDIRYLERQLSSELGEAEAPASAGKETSEEGGEEIDGAVIEPEVDTRIPTEPVLEDERPAGVLDEKITLELKGVDVLDVLKILSKKSGLNIVAGKNVRGQVTLFLQDVDVWTALLTVLETSELAYVEESGIIKVMGVKDYETLYGKTYKDRRLNRSYILKYAKAIDVSTALSQIKSPLGTVIVDERSNAVIATDFPSVLEAMEETIRVVDKPNETRFFQVRYADVEDIESKITEIITPGTGTLKIDSRTNKIVVTDVPEKVSQIAEIVRAFDSEPRQVLIEAKIVEVSLNDDFIFGIDWQLVLDSVRGGERLLNIDSRAFGGIASPSDAPVTSPLSSISTSSNPGFGTIFVNNTTTSSSDDFNAIVSVLEGISKVNVLSNPRITVLDKQEARIAIATKQPFVSQTVVQATNTATTADNVEFVDVGVTMAVTPTITDTGFVLMQIRPEVSTAGQPLTLQGAGQSATTSEALFTRTIVPVVTSQEAETTILVRSGEMVILGGLIQKRDEDVRRKIPFLGDIPILGAAFRNGGQDFSLKELVIFITPTIVPPYSLDTTDYDRYFNEKGLHRDINEAGGYIYEKGKFYSQDPFSVNSRPFWRVDGVEGRQFFPSRGRYADPTDPYAHPSKLAVAAPPAGAVTSLEGYSQAIQQKITSAVHARKDFADVGKINLILTLRNDGSIEEVSFFNPAIQGNENLQQKFIESIQSAGPFPQFPSSASQPRQSFTLSL